MAVQTVEWEDVQCLLLSGLGHHKQSRNLLLRVENRSEAKSWLRSLLARGVVRSAHQVNSHNVDSSDLPDHIVSIAMTFSGLRALGIEEDTLETFPPEFQEGMTGTDRRRHMLGDVDASAPSKWAWGWRALEPHVLIQVFARSKAHLDPVKLERAIGTPTGFVTVDGDEIGPEGTTGLLTYVPEDRREHFGFVDGISQPLIEGTPSAECRRYGPNEISIIKAGELILGYDNERGLQAPSPSVDTNAHGADLLSSTPGRRDLGRNGSYLVVRQIAQDVAAFHKSVAAIAPSKKEQGLAAARLMGRWPSGAPLVRHPHTDPLASGEEWSRENDFLFDREDPEGIRCPIGAHIRRSNPRDSLLPDPETALRLSKRRRILRRGRLYDRGACVSTAHKEELGGIFFMCCNADIADQFELIQHSWINNPHFSTLYDESDPIAATHKPRGDRFTVQGSPTNVQTPELEAFTTVRGGAYFFLPGLRALNYLSHS